MNEKAEKIETKWIKMKIRNIENIGNKIKNKEKYWKNIQNQTLEVPWNHPSRSRFPSKYHESVSCLWFLSTGIKIPKISLKKLKKFFHSVFYLIRLQIIHHWDQRKWRRMALFRHGIHLTLATEDNARVWKNNFDHNTEKKYSNFWRKIILWK